MIFNEAQRAAVKEVEPHWKSNLWVRLVILVFNIVCMGLVLGQQIPSFWNIAVYTVLSLSMAWVLFNIIYRLCKTKPVHPGVHVGFELILWGGILSIACVSFTLVGDFDTWRWRPIAMSRWAANIVACTLATVVSILHFYLFVRACMDTERWRMNGLANQAASMAAQIVKNMESRGTFYRRGSQGSYVYSPSEQGGHILGLDELHLAERGRPMEREDLYNNTGFTAVRPSNMSQISHARSGMSTTLSQARTQISYSRSMSMPAPTSHYGSVTARTELSIPVPTSPMTLRTARTDELSLFSMGR